MYTTTNKEDENDYIFDLMRKLMAREGGTISYHKIHEHYKNK
jgi:hypothetical protein